MVGQDDDPRDVFLVGLDVGSQSVRAVLVDGTGRVAARAARPTPTRTRGEGRAEYDLAALWDGVRDVLSEVAGLLPPGRGMAGVAVASVGEACVLLDARDQPVGEAIAWFDRRTEDVAARLTATLSDRIFDITGHVVDPTFTLCKLLWHRESDPARFAGVTRVLNIADWIAWRLCGEAATDFSLASRTLCLDIRGGRWSTELAEAVGLDVAVLPPIRPAGTALGRARRELGLPGDPIVAVGGHDHVVGGYAAGAAGIGSLLDSMGTAEALLRIVSRPPLTAATRATGFAQGLSGVGRAYVGGGINSSGGTVEWARGLFGETDAATAPVGSMGVCFVPHLAYAPPPDPDFSARGAFVGLRADTSKAAMARAVLEGLAFEARRMADALASLEGVGPPLDIRVIGGSTRNELFLRIKAAVFGRAIGVVETPEATALGAALLAGVGAGLWPDVDSACAAAAAPSRVVAPDPAWTEFYAERYDRAWRHVAPALRPVNRRLGDDLAFPAACDNVAASQ